MATGQASNLGQHLRRAGLLGDGAGVPDGELLRCFIERRDEAAFAALVRRHGPMVWGVCCRLLHRRQDVEDAFQATFLVLVKKAASVVPREMVGNWLYGVARRTALNARAAGVKRGARETQVTDMPEPAVPAQDPWSDLLPVLDQELGHLPDRYRAVIILCDLEGKTRKEAARQLRVPEGTVSGRLARARAMLAKRLARHGLSVSGVSLASVLSRGVASAGVPTSVVSDTIKAAGLAAAGRAATAGPVSVRVAALTEGVLKTMLLTKLKNVIALLLILTAVGTGVVFSYPHLRAAGPGAAPNDVPAATGRKADGQLALRKARLAAASKVYEDVWYEYQSGLHEEEAVYRWSLRLLEARRAVAETRADEVKAVEAHLDRMKKLEKVAPDRMVVVPLERVDANGKPRLGVGFTKDGKRSGVNTELGLRPPHATGAAAFFRSEAEVWLAEAENRKPMEK